MAEPLPAINIDQLTNSVAQVLAPSPQDSVFVTKAALDVAPPTQDNAYAIKTLLAAPTKNNEPVPKSMAGSTSTPRGGNVAPSITSVTSTMGRPVLQKTMSSMPLGNPPPLPVPITNLPMSSPVIGPFMLLHVANVGGRPTVLPVGDQITGGKFAPGTMPPIVLLANPTQGQLVPSQAGANTLTSLGGVWPQQATATSTTLTPSLSSCELSTLPSIQPLPPSTQTPQLSNALNKQKALHPQHVSNIRGHVPIQPKPLSSTCATSAVSVPTTPQVGEPQIGQTVQSIPTSSGPILPKAATPIPTHIHRLTPTDLQTLLSQYTTTPGLLLQSVLGESNLGSGEKRPDQTGSDPSASVTRMAPPHVIPALPPLSTPSTPIPPPPNLLPALNEDLSGSNSTLMSNEVSSDVQPIVYANPVSVADQQGLSSVQHLMTGLDTLSPNPVYLLGGDRELRGDTPVNSYLMSNSWSVIDSLLKSHGGDLSLGDKPSEGQSAFSKEPDCPVTPIPAVSTPPMEPESTQPQQFFCLSCNKTNDAECSVHRCTYNRVFDEEMPTMARQTLPTVLAMWRSNITGLPGVWSKCSLPSHTVFGPLTGKPTSAEGSKQAIKHNFFIWKIFSEGKTVGLNVEDENESNWMRFVRPARTSLEQNIVAYQQGGQIFFITSRDIVQNEELLLWYAKDYAQLLGVPEAPGAILLCNLCTKSFPTNKALVRHQRYAHADMSTRKWKCEYCGHGFNSPSKLESHVLSHLGVKPHVCVSCGKKFTEKPNLMRHMRIHTGERNFTCTQCGRGFRQKAHLQSHILIHTGQRNIACRYCEKMFARTSDLKQHEYQHTKEKVFTCPTCSKVFYKLQNFKKHSKIHTGQKDFECQRCEKTFFTRYHVKRHLQTCKGTKGSRYTLEPEDPELVALNMDGSEGDIGIPLDSDTDIQNDKQVKHRPKGKHKA